MTTIIFESHGTTTDNEAHRSSGWNDVDLSDLGERQAQELADRYRGRAFHAVYCSALKRSYRTAEQAFRGSNIPIFRDARLNECNYGEFNGRPSKEVEPVKRVHIHQPFPNGQSYEQTTEQMRLFIEEIIGRHKNETIIVIGHRATQYGLEYILNGVPLEQAVIAPWKWQPGWTYTAGNV